MNRPAGTTIPGQTRPAWRRALDEAVGQEGSNLLDVAMRRDPPPDARERCKFLRGALQLAEGRADHEVLIALLALDDPSSRVSVLAVVLRVADELSPRFDDLMDALREDERMMVLGALLDGSRLDPVPERRLLRLARLIRVIPADARGLYWSEAEALAEAGGDDAQLTLLGIARQLPSASLAWARTSLRRAAERVEHAYKRSMAFAALAELTTSSRLDVREALEAARRVPDATLRILARERISRIGGHGSG